MDDAVPLTREGYDMLTKELEKLKKNDRPNIIKEIEEARSHGDLKENAEYHAAREKQGFIEGRIADLEDKLARAKVIDFTGDTSGVVKFGAMVTICDENTGDEKTLHIVGDLEADLDKGKISLSSPIARALLGKSLDDVAVVKAPKGAIEYSIVGIRYS